MVEVLASEPITMHPYWFVHRIVPRQLARAPEGVDPRLAADLDDADRILGGYWRAAAEVCDEAPGELPPRSARLNVGGRPGLLIVMPPTRRETEASHVASVPDGAGWRFFTFELPSDPLDGPMLGEVLATGDRVDHGGGPGFPTVEVFLDRITGVIGVPVAVGEVPRRFTPTPPPVRAPEPASRSGWWVAAGAALLSLIGVAGALWALR
jgi:hypothetical protein